MKEVPSAFILMKKEAHLSPAGKRHRFLTLNILGRAAHSQINEELIGRLVYRPVEADVLRTISSHADLE